MKNLFLVLAILISQSSLAITLGEWANLDRFEKFELLQNEEVDYEEFDIDDITQEEIIKEVRLAEKYTLKNVSTEAIEQELFNIEGAVVIGDPKATWVNIYKIENKIVAYQIGLIQSGGATKNGRDPEQKYYENEEEALQAGIDVNADVSWSAAPMVEVKNNTVIEIELDVYNEGGFHWSGW